VPAPDRVTRAPRDVDDLASALLMS
jgi:hypothetical protein